jgi:gliding motility-associated-like protein
MIGAVNTYTQTTFTHTPSNIGLQSQYYYVTTISGTNTSVPSDTLRSIFLILSNPGNGVVGLNWNAIKTPSLLTSSPSYTLSREAPAGNWTPIYSGNKLNYKDTIYRCKVYYNYKVEISDSYGCISISNIPGDTCYNVQSPKIIALDSVSVNSSGQAVIGWEPAASSDVVSYIIYSVSPGNFLTGLDTIYGYNNTSFTYTGSLAGTSSEGYCIAAIDSCGNYSIPSISHNSIFLNAPTYDLCLRTASFAWTPYSNLPKGILKYDIYCSVNGNSYTNIGSTLSTSFSHTALIPGDVYCYIIRVKNTDLSISASSNVQCVTASGLPGPSYAYINSVSVITENKQIEISFTIDDTNPYKGCNIYKSEDGLTFTKLAFVPYSAITPQKYLDKNVKTSEKNYFYKIQVADNCNNPGVWSDTSKTILLHVSSDIENIFYNTLTWDDYSKWNASVESFNIYRAVNGVFDPNPISNVSYATRTYLDDVQNFVSDKGKFSYFVEAVEGSGNIYGFKDVAKSNPADAYLEVSVFVPNAFAPKGINNVWLPIAQYVEKTDYKVMVFNRWGTKVFETTDDTEGWTGDAATDEVYVYVIEYKNARGEYIQLKGHFNIIR